MSPEQLRKFAPNCDAAALASALDAAAAARQINTPARLAHWLGQLYIESGGFTRFVENLNYSAERICQVWQSRFPDVSAAAHFAHNPQALAEKVYGGRYGNAHPGDGWKYRGRGLIQITFHDNYAAASKWSGYDLLADPDLAAAPVTACMIAAAFWSTKGLNELADRNDDESITRIVNGSVNSWAARHAQVTRAKAIFA